MRSLGRMWLLGLTLAGSAWILTAGQSPLVTSGKVNCANYQNFDWSATPGHAHHGYSYIPESPSGGDRTPGSGYVVGEGNDCLITIEDTTVPGQHNDRKIPSSSCSAFAITSIGNYVLYGTAPPYRGIAAFALECRSNHPISEDMLFLPFEHYVTQIAVSSTGNEFQHSTTLIVTLNDRHPPTAFEILTSGDRFRLSPCVTLFPHEFVTDVALLDRNKVTIVVLSLDNLNAQPHPKDRYAPIYLSAYSHRNATLCGYIAIEHTQKVELFFQDGNIIAALVQRLPPQRKRSFIRFFTIRVTGKVCKAEPWAAQSVIGALPWETGFSVLPAGNPALLFPFTVDNVLCGVEDIKIVQTSTFTALVVAVANADTCLENSCTPEEMLTFEQSNSAGNVRICGCAYAIKTSFAIMFSKSAKKFALDVNQPSFFQFLKVGPEMASEIQTIMLPCCVLVQLCSTAGNCELFTLRLDQRTNEFDAGRISGTRLPSLVASSAVGTCRINTVAVSYSGIEPSTRPTIHKFSCTNFQESQHLSLNSDGPRFHLALHNGTGTHFPVSDSLPGNRRHSATPFYVVPPPMNNPAGNLGGGTNWNLGEPVRGPGSMIGGSVNQGRDRFFGDAPMMSPPSSGMTGLRSNRFPDAPYYPEVVRRSSWNGMGQANADNDLNQQEGFMRHDG